MEKMKSNVEMLLWCGWRGFYANKKKRKSRLALHIFLSLSRCGYKNMSFRNDSNTARQHQIVIINVKITSNTTYFTLDEAIFISASDYKFFFLSFDWHVCPLSVENPTFVTKWHTHKSVEWMHFILLVFYI